MWVWSLDWDEPLEEDMATLSSILACRIPWTEEPGGLHPWGYKELDTTEHAHVWPLSTLRGPYGRMSWLAKFYKQKYRTFKFEFQVNMDDVLVYLYPVQHFIIHSLPGHQKKISNLNFSWITYILSGNPSRCMSFSRVLFNHKHILNIFLQEVGYLEEIHQKHLI